MDDLKHEIKLLIIEALELEDIAPADIVDEAPLFGEGLGLDSIDALELGVALKKKFNVKFSAENAETRKHFASVDALAAYIKTAGGAA
jgi:acyl carrier protein